MGRLGVREAGARLGQGPSRRDEGMRPEPSRDGGSEEVIGREGLEPLGEWTADPAPPPPLSDGDEG